MHVKFRTELARDEWLHVFKETFLSRTKCTWQELGNEDASALDRYWPDMCPDDAVSDFINRYDLVDWETYN